MTAVSIDARVVSTPEVMGGEPRIQGRRIRVKDIVVWYEYFGMSADEISATYNLTLADVFSALAYYHLHGEALRTRWATDDKIVEEIMKSTPSKIITPQILKTS